MYSASIFSMGFRTGIWMGMVVILAAGLPNPAFAFLSFEGPPIEYSTRPVNDPVKRLHDRIEAGEVRMNFDDRYGYLKELLKLLDIPIASQLLVYSKTSFQTPYISPQTPRAIYFNDDVYVGWVQGGDVLEISSVDPEQGAIFYSLLQSREDTPVFDRQTDACLQCHASPLTESIPGHLNRSVFTDHSGQPVLKAGTFKVTQNSPLSERWGGWYVTGRHGEQRHMGNVHLTGSDNPEDLPSEQGGNITRLDGMFDVSPYLTPHSDLVAHLVLAHQTTLHNLITHANYQARIALAIQAEMNERDGKTVEDLSEGTLQRFSYAADGLLRCLLFAGEAPLQSPVRGTSGYREEFEQRGPRDSRGRSLRDFDLRTRMFKYPCSFLIYSESFDALPAPFRDYLLKRLFDVLTGDSIDPTFSHLTPEDRKAILEILIETKENLPGYWKEAIPG